MLYALFSYISNITSVFGSYFAICLHSSEPIEPPPPVTNIVLPFIKLPIFSLSSLIGSLPKISSISTFFRFSNKFLFFIISATLGNILTLALVCWQICNISFLFFESILAIEKNMS